MTSENDSKSSSSAGQTKLYAAVGVLALMGGALALQMQKSAAEAKSHSAETVQKALPSFSIEEAKANAATKITIKTPASKDGDKAQAAVTHVLVKEGESWKLAEPLAAPANQSNVESLLKNLPKLSLKERIADSDSNYAQYDLSDDKAVSVLVEGAEGKVAEFLIGKSGGRGQLIRLPGVKGVFSVEGFSSFLYRRDTKGWRDLTVLKLDTDKVAQIDIKNEHGEFLFKKEADKWTGKFKPAKGGALAPIKEFETSKVEDLLRAYKTLNASGFGDDKGTMETGLTQPSAVLTFTVGEEKKSLEFGTTAEGSSRYAQVAGSPTVYLLSSWAADWAVAESSKFEKSKGDADAKPEPSPLELGGE